VILAAAALLAWLAQAAPPATPPQAAEGFAAVTGTILDSRTHRPLTGARVLLVESNRAVITKADGRFEFRDVVPGKFTLTVSLIGYAFVRRPLEVGRGVTMDIPVPVTEGTGAYQEQVTVKADETPPPEVGVSSQMQLGSAAILALRGVAADDPMRAMQALPGVATGNELDAEFSMRGFAFRHLGIVMDGTATPLLLHAIRGEGDSGSIAMINSDVLDGASLFAGPHPQRDGDWLGSTLSFAVREGSRDRAGFRVSVSGTSASAVAEGPIGGSHRGAWLVSVRKSYIDWLVKKIAPDLDTTLGFADTQGKFTFDLTRRQQVQLMFVGGTAQLDQPKQTGANSLNRATSRGGVAAGGWRYAGDKSIYRMRVAFTDNVFNNTGANRQVLGTGDEHERSWRGDGTWILSPRWTAEAGLKTQWTHGHSLMQSFLFSRGVPLLRAKDDGVKGTWTSDAWGQVTWRGDRGGVTMGVRTAHDSLMAVTLPSPWVLAERRAGALTFRASAGGSHQFPGLDAQIGAIGPLDPERAVSGDLGVEGRVGRGWGWMVTGFVRQDHQLTREVGLDQILGGQRIVAATFPQFTSALSGPTHGADVVVSRRAATGLTGWVAYTFAHTRYHDRNTGESFDGDFDQRHTLNVFLEERLSYRWAVNGKLRVGSNFPLTGYFAGTPGALTLGPTYNAVRLPVYARLDLRANRTFTFNRRRLTLFVEVLNVFNRDNFGQLAGSINPSTLVASNFTTRLIPRIPSAGFLLEF
jgi:hypothetical protein